MGSVLKALSILALGLGSQLAPQEWRSTLGSFQPLCRSAHGGPADSHIWRSTHRILLSACRCIPGTSSSIWHIFDHIPQPFTTRYHTYSKCPRAGSTGYQTTSGSSLTPLCFSRATFGEPQLSRQRIIL